MQCFPIIATAGPKTTEKPKHRPERRPDTRTHAKLAQGGYTVTIMHNPKADLVAEQPPKIRKLDYYDSEATRFWRGVAHELDPEFQAPEKLPNGVNKFAGTFYLEVRKQVLSGNINPDVRKVMNDIYDAAIPAARRRVVWRSVGGMNKLDEASGLATAEVGDVVEHNLPTSTSTNPAIGIRFGKNEMLLKIIVPEGTPTIVCNSQEMKVLLRQGFGLRIDRIDCKVPAWEGHKKLYIIKKVIQAMVIPG